MPFSKIILLEVSTSLAKERKFPTEQNSVFVLSGTCHFSLNIPTVRRYATHITNDASLWTQLAKTFNAVYYLLTGF